MKRFFLIVISFSIICLFSCNEGKHSINNIPDNIELKVGETYFFDVNFEIDVSSVDQDLIFCNDDEKQFTAIKEGKCNLIVKSCEDLSIFKNINIVIIPSLSENFFDFLPVENKINIGENLVIETSEDIAIISSNENVYIKEDENKIFGVSSGESIINLYVKNQPSISKEITIVIIDDYTDYFPNIPYYIEISPNTEYIFKTEDNLKIDIIYEDYYSTGAIKINNNSSGIYTLYSGTAWLEISSLDYPDRKKKVYVCSMDKSDDCDYYESYFIDYTSSAANDVIISEYLVLMDKGFSNKFFSYSYYFVKNKYELYNIFENGLCQNVPRQFIELSLNDYEVILIYSYGPYDRSKRYFGFDFDETKSQINLGMNIIYSAREECYFENLDFIIIPKTDIPSEFKVDNIKNYPINFIYFPS